MSALEQARDLHLALAERFAAARAGDPAWLQQLRAEATAHFRAQGLPTTREEEWRYTSLRDLAGTDFSLPAAGELPVSRSDVESVAFPVFACSLYVFVDGRYEPKLSALGAGADVHIESLAELATREPELLRQHLGQLASAKEHPFAALNAAFLGDGAVLRVPRGVDVEEPLHLVFLSTGGEPAPVTHPRVLVVAEAGSQVRLIQDHVSVGGGTGFSNAVTEVFVGANARVDLVLLQRKASDAFHLSNLAARVERDGRFASHTLTLGGRLVRNDLAVTLADEGADATLGGLFFGAGEQVIDNHTLVDHAMPHGTSRELYKGILGGDSRGVFRGRVLVRPDAQKTDAEQSNPNLLLSAGAEIDTKPQLEIHADDVKCSHGSTIGQLEEDALFYLRSRAIDLPRARDLLTFGFAREILAALPVPALAEGLEESLLARLAEATGREEPR
ncbi:MAG: Fe-S cluster assembly protein SufD [Myxococcota bacterium]